MAFTRSVPLAHASYSECSHTHVWNASQYEKKGKPHKHRLCYRFFQQIMCAFEHNLSQFLFLKFKNYFLYTRPRPYSSSQKSFAWDDCVVIVPTHKTMAKTSNEKPTTDQKSNQKGKYLIALFFWLDNPNMIYYIASSDLYFTAYYFLFPFFLFTCEKRNPHQ